VGGGGEKKPVLRTSAIYIRVQFFVVKEVTGEKKRRMKNISTTIWDLQ
jgi:hypothetical protein